MKLKIGKKLVLARKKLGLNQTQFAEKLGIGQSAIANIENDTRGVSENLAIKLKEVFNIDIEELILEPQRDSNVVPIPFYRVGASAGAGCDLPNYPEKDILYFDERWIRNILGVLPKNLHLIFAKGDSMDSGFNTTTDIKDGDLLMIDTSQTEGNGRTYVICVNGTELRVKKLTKKLDGTLIITSNNANYKEEIYRPDEQEIEIRVIGRVVWNGSKENI